MDSLTRQDAAARLGISRKTLYRWMAQAGMSKYQRLTMGQLGQLGRLAALHGRKLDTDDSQEVKATPVPPQPQAEALLLLDRVQRLEDRVAALEHLLRFSPFLPPKR
jgi:hypothetical protein